MTDNQYRRPNRFAEKQAQRNRRSQAKLRFCIALLLLLTAAGLIVIFCYQLRPEDSSPSDHTPQEDPVSDAEEEIPPEDPTLFTVCVDAGHGGKDIGCDSGGRIEKEDTLKLAQALSDVLKSMQIKVVMTREDDTFLYLSERCRAAKKEDADYLVSLHRNKGNGNGAETWISSHANEENTALAQNIMDNLETAGISRNRGIKQGSYNDDEEDYYITSNALMPSCIVELGFINDSEDNRLYDANLDAYARAIADALMSTYTAFRTENSEDSAQEETAAPSAEGKNITNIVIEDVEALSSECLDYGQGVIVDEENRPVTSVQYEEKYADYHVHFVDMENALTQDGRKKIYLTFDEGYEYGCTEDILNTLAEKDVKAVFFVTLPYVKDEPELVQRIIKDGHVLGNHSTTHPSKGLPSQEPDVQAQEIETTDAYVKEQYGYSMYLFRFPAGKFSEQSLAIVNNCNYESVFWSFAYLDYDVNNQPNRAESLQKMTDRLHAGAIYLLHAESATNAAVLGDFIDQAREQGYEFCILE